MKSPCLHCGKEVAHLIHERPFCSVGCNADYANVREHALRWASEVVPAPNDGVLAAPGSSAAAPLREAWDRLRTEIAMRVPNHLRSAQFYEALNDVEGGVRAAESSTWFTGEALDREEAKRAVQAVLGWQHGWCADCEPVSRREDMDHHEEGGAYWEAVQALAKLVGLTRSADRETVEQITDHRWYRRHLFGGVIEPAWPEADAAEKDSPFTSRAPEKQ